MMFCAVCLGAGVEQPAEPITFIHGYAVCSPHMTLMVPGAIWVDVVANAKKIERGEPIELPKQHGTRLEPVPKIKSAPVRDAAGTDIWGHILEGN